MFSKVKLADLITLTLCSHDGCNVVVLQVYNMYTMHTICIRCVRHLHSVHIQCVCTVQMVYLLDIGLAYRAHEFSQKVTHPNFHSSVTTMQHLNLVVVVVLIYTQNVSGRMRTQHRVLTRTLVLYSFFLCFLKEISQTHGCTAHSQTRMLARTVRLNAQRAHGTPGGAGRRSISIDK